MDGVAPCLSRPTETRQGASGLLAPDLRRSQLPPASAASPFLHLSSPEPGPQTPPALVPWLSSHSGGFPGGPLSLQQCGARGIQAY